MSFLLGGHTKDRCPSFHSGQNLHLFFVLHKMNVGPGWLGPLPFPARVQSTEHSAGLLHFVGSDAVEVILRRPSA